MWTQYTREKPAHPGWTIATMAVALAVTIGLAQMQVAARQPETWDAAMTIDAPEWPLTFKLPANLTWKAAPSESTSEGERIYVGSRNGEHVCRVSFYIGPQEAPAINAVYEKLPEDAGTFDQHLIKIAGEEGFIAVISPPTGSRYYAWCLADQLDGKRISIFIETKLKPPFALQLADWLGESATRKPGAAQ